jgi:hypothetical protein
MAPEKEKGALGFFWAKWPPRPTTEELHAALPTLEEAGWYDYKRRQAEEEDSRESD